MHGGDAWGHGTRLESSDLGGLVSSDLGGVVLTTKIVHALSANLRFSVGSIEVSPFDLRVRGVVGSRTSQAQL